MKRDLFKTDQATYYNARGAATHCADTWQDGVLKRLGASWPEPRFLLHEDTVIDRLTGLMWTKDANCATKAVSWQLAIDAIKTMNAAEAYGHGDWRLPNIRELESLTDMGSHTPALPAAHPFKRVQEWYWSSTTSTYEPRYAWVLYQVDGAVGVGYKQYSEFFVWAVRGVVTDSAV